MALLGKKYSPKIEGARKVVKKRSTYLLEKEQLKELKDMQLVRYRSKVMMDKNLSSTEHWAQMWSCNAEMAKRFRKIVEKREAKKNDNNRS